LKQSPSLLSFAVLHSKLTKEKGDSVSLFDERLCIDNIDYPSNKNCNHANYKFFKLLVNP